jgi:DNA-binding response OmpR family regulator
MPMVVLKKRPTIFICEPERKLEDHLADYLTAKGFSVRCIADSGRAVDEIITRMPDLVLLDARLAPAGGFEVCRAVRSFYCGPILFLGADPDEAPQLLAFEGGADDYILTPVSLSSVNTRA